VLLAALWVLLAVATASAQVIVAQTPEVVPLPPLPEVPPPPPPDVPPPPLPEPPSPPPETPIERWEMNLAVRPLFHDGGVREGVVADASIGYRLRPQLKLSAVVHPFTLATGDHGTTRSLVALLMLSRETQDTDGGIGVGVQSVNYSLGLFRFLGAFISAWSKELQPGYGLVVSQFGRYGHRDRFTLSVRADVMVFRKRVDISGLLFEMQVPLTDKPSVWAMATTGLSSAGYALAEVGIRGLLLGDGERGSWFGSVTLGTATLFVVPLCDPERREPCRFHYAPTWLGVGTEWRL